MRIAFIDLETTGLPKHPSFNVYYPYTQLKSYDSSRIVQMSLLIYDVVGEVFTLVADHTYIIKPDGFIINNAHIHRISNTIATLAGIPFVDVIANIKNDLLQCDTLIAHNILFDKNILLSELHRYNQQEVIYAINRMHHFCTSKGCTNITKIRYNAREFKQPKLSELYKFVFKRDLLNAHDASVDTKALAACFIELYKKKLIVRVDGKLRCA